jgi:hypothetical protein
MCRFFRDNGLSVTLLICFLVFWLGQALAGWFVFNDEQIDHGGFAVSLGTYLTSPHFIEATAENWESEFLQMAAYVALTAFLFQRGSAESKGPDEPGESDKPVPAPQDLAPDAPRALRHTGWIRTLYSYSLSLAFGLLFVIALISHALSGHQLHNEDLIEHGKPAISLIEYVIRSQFWFEAFQNWQSEFLAVFAICVLSIFLRHKGSPESKPVDMPHRENP